MSSIQIAVLAGILVMIPWGLVDIFTKKGIDKVGPFVATVYFQLVSSLTVIPLLFYDPTIPEISFSRIAMVIILSIMDMIGFIILFKAYEIGKVSIINPITSSFAILAGIISFVFFGEVFSQFKFLAFFVIILGILLTAIDLKGLKDGLQSKDFAKGVPLAILCFTIWGVYVPLWDRLIEGEGWVVLSLMSKIIMLLFTLFFTTIIRKQSIKISGKKTYTVLVIAGILDGLGSIAFNWGLNNSQETSILAALASAYPLVLIIAAYFILKEKISLNQYLGIFLIIAGIILSSLI